jgi:hypothetical protein
VSAWAVWIVAGGLFIAWRAILAWWHPRTDCGWCDGSGRNWGSSSRRSGDCPFCRGRGKRLRLEARLLRKMRGG